MISQYQKWFEIILLGYFAGINLVYTTFLLIAGFRIANRVRETKEEDTSHILKSDSFPSILFIVPVHNGAETLIANISNILLLSYRYKQIITVNDGSEDNSFDIMMKEFELIQIPKYYEDELPTQKIRGVYRSQKYAEIMVLDKENGGKFDAVNAAINASTCPFFVVLDADTFLDSKQFEALVRPILTSPDTIGVGASIRIMNGCEIEYNRIKTAQFPKQFIPAMQSLEYLRAFCLRDGLDAINGNFIISGAFSIFPKDLVVQIGGFAPSCGEDVEIVMRLQRLMREAKIPYRVRYFSDPVAYTLAPTDLKTLANQRVRWHLGFLEALWFHRRMCLNPRYGFFGFFGYTFWVFGEAIEPIVEAIGWIYVIVAWILGIAHMHFFLLMFAITLGYTALYTIFALAIEEFSYRKYPSFRSLVMLLLANLLENIGYRQLSVYWRLKGCFMFLKTFKKIRATSSFIGGLMVKAHQMWPNSKRMKRHKEQTQN